MDSGRIIMSENSTFQDKSSDLNTEQLSKYTNIIYNSSESPIDLEKSAKCLEKTHVTSNGSINESNSLNVATVTSELGNVNFNSPSTSGLENRPRQEVAKSISISVSAENDGENDSQVVTSATVVSSNCSDNYISHYRPNTLPFEKTKRRVLKISPEEISSPDSPLSEDETKFISPETDSQDELENSIMVILNNSEKPEMIPELTLDEEQAELRNWKACTIAGVKRQIDLKVIEPYKRVLSHGGYLNTGSHNAIITFSACFLPHKSRKDYNYVMDNLFFYILHTLNQLVTDDYVLVYLHGGTTKDCIPTFSWLKRCYRMIDRKLKKNLKALYLVHPTFWLKTLVTMIKPFISSKFSRKIHFVNSLSDLIIILPIEEASIPDKVKQYDRIKMSLSGN